MMLSICIATYNRAECLAELLESVCEQGMADVEVIVGDDASPDNTAATVERFRARLPGLRYIRHERNLGCDRNFLSVVEAATGKFVWLVGDDDRLKPGALRVVLAQLDEWPEVCGLTPGVIDYDHDLRQPVGIRFMPNTMRLQGVEEVFGAIVDLLGFISVTVVNRRMWLRACQDNSLADYMNGYIQVYVIGCMIGRSGFWGVLDVPCIDYRTDNDQLLSRVGWFRRVEIDVVSYDQIFRGLLPGRLGVVAKLNRRILQTHVMSRIYNAKSGSISYGDLLRAFALLRRFYGGAAYIWIYVLPVMTMPSWMVRILRRFYWTCSSRSGVRRARALSNSGSEEA